MGIYPRTLRRQAWLDHDHAMDETADSKDHGDTLARDAVCEMLLL